MVSSFVGWGISALSIIGAILNAFGKTLGFYVWVVANTCWIVDGICTHSYSQLPMWITYDVISIIGIIVWRRKKIK